ncbi:MAG: zinc ribbon domain-containing protein [Lachnospiraceae bacterium]|nr:zinc ribbon domain-containing protein [Lachnospiraceae bacterium]
MKCKHCQYELEEGGLFCPNCGIKVEIETEMADSLSQEKHQFCPNCGKALEMGAVFCEHCGYRLDEATKGKENKEKKSIKKKVFVGIGALAVFAVMGGILAPKISGLIPVKMDETVSEIFYVKDKGIYGVSLKNPKKKSVEYTDDLAKRNDVVDAAGGISGFPMYSKDKRYHFIIEDYSIDEDGSSFTLYCKDGKDKKVKIDSGVNYYQITENNKIFYQKNGDLYVNNLKEKKKVASDVSNFWFDKKENNVFWHVENEDSKDLYFQSINQNNDKVKLASGIDYLYSAPDDKGKILYYKNDSIYTIRNLEESEKLAGDAFFWGWNDTENLSFYYFNKVEKNTLSEYIIDDLEDQDAVMEEPNQADYEREETSGSGLWAYQRTVIDDAFYQAQAEYAKKQRRDELRAQLDDYEMESMYLLYYSENGENKEFSGYMMDPINKRKCSDYVNEEKRKSNADYKGFLIYSKFKMDELKRIKMSELGDDWSIDALYDRVSTMIEAASSYYLAVGGEEKELDIDDGELDTFRYGADLKNNQAFLCLMHPDDHTTLISVDLDAENFGEITERDEDIVLCSVPISEGNVYYYKDYNEEKRVGDLYRNGELILEDASNVMNIKDSDSILCFQDYNNEKKRGTLMLVKRDGETKISDDVYSGYNSILAINDHSIAMLSDFSDKHKKGDLKYFDGKETYLIDTDVYGIINRQ